jgi:hypothetical protein
MSGPLNTDYFTQLTAQINQCATCAELQALATAALEDLNAQLAVITGAAAAFEALQALLTAPEENLSAIVTWISTLITQYLGPQLAAYAKLAAQVVALTAEIAALTAAITAAAARLENCTIVIP